MKARKAVLVYQCDTAHVFEVASFDLSAGDRIKDHIFSGSVKDGIKIIEQKMSHGFSVTTACYDREGDVRCGSWKLGLGEPCYLGRVMRSTRKSHLNKKYLDSTIAPTLRDKQGIKIVNSKGKPRRRKNDPVNDKMSSRYKEVYIAYLDTPEWSAKRRIALANAGHRCQVCNAENCRLDVHHRTYERFGVELETDLIVLCRKCHKIFHAQGRLARWK
jgi:hypothetical protein